MTMTMTMMIDSEEIETIQELVSNCNDCHHPLLIVVDWILVVFEMNHCNVRHIPNTFVVVG
jgi:hypothetical protein